MNSVPNVYGDYSICAEVLNDPCRLMRVGDSIDVSDQNHMMRGFRPSLWGGWLENGLALSSNVDPVATRSYGGGGNDGAFHFPNDAGYYNHVLGVDVCVRWPTTTAYGAHGEWYLNRTVDAAVPSLYDAAQSFGRRLFLNNPDVEWDFETIWVTSPQSPNGKVQMAAGSNWDYFNWHANTGPVNLNSAALGFTKVRVPLNKTGMDGTRVLNFPIRVVDNQTLNAGEAAMLANFGFVRRDNLGLVMVNCNFGGYTTAPSGPGAFGDPANFSDAAWHDHLTVFGATHVMISLSANAPGTTVAIVRDRVQAIINKVRTAGADIGIIIATKYETNGNHVQMRDVTHPAYLQVAADNLRTVYLDIWNESGADEYNLHDTFVVNESGVYTHPNEAGRWADWWWKNILMQRAADATAAAVLVSDSVDNHSILFDGVTASDSTTTRVMLAADYDPANYVRFIGAYLIVDTFGTVLITNYGNPGSGASYVDVEPYDSPPPAGLRARVVLSSVATGAGGTGSGDTPVDHSGAAGVTVNGVASATDIMRFTVGGTGADDVEVVAYLKGDYDAGLRGTANRRGTTMTGTDGRWVAPLMLDAGTYTILGSKSGYRVEVETVVVP